MQLRPTETAPAAGTIPSGRLDGIRLQRRTMRMKYHAPDYIAWRLPGLLAAC